MKEGDVYDILRRLATRLREEEIEYAVIGGMALVAQGYRRFTEVVDVLMTPEALRRFREQLVGRGYVPAFASAAKSFRDAQTGIKIEVVTSGEYPGDGKPKSVSFPDPKDAREEQEGLWVIAVDKLIELKLASGLSAAHRLRDLSDVQELITILDLPVSLADQLDPGVSPEYRRLWGLAQQARADPHARA
jgi:hypothetical protein